MAVDDMDSGARSWLGSLWAVCGRVSFSRRKVATGAAAVLALGVGYHVIFGANGVTVYEKKREQTRELQVQLQDLQRQNEALRAHVERLKDDPDAIEHEAREELHYTRPGEVIYALPETPKSASSASASQ